MDKFNKIIMIINIAHCINIVFMYNEKLRLITYNIRFCMIFNLMGKNSLYYK